MCDYVHVHTPNQVRSLVLLSFWPGTRGALLYAADCWYNKRLRAKDEPACRNPITLLRTKRSLERFLPISL
jgi:hypothetical protein